MWVVIAPTCCAAGLQIHKYLKVLWGWSSYCCGAVHPAQQIRNWPEIRGWEKQTKQAKCSSIMDLWSQRLVDFLHQPSEAATVHGFGQGVAGGHRLLVTERANHLWEYFNFNTKTKTPSPQKNNQKPNQTNRSLFIYDLFSFGSEFLVSECLLKGRAVNSQQLENNNTSVLGCASS